MNKEIQFISSSLQSVTNGEPWFGRSVYELLAEADEDMVFNKPGNDGHSLIELVYHLLTWTEFTLHRIDGNKEIDLAATEKMDWREIDPSIHSWKDAVSRFKKANKAILERLHTKDDNWLNEKVDYRKYDFRFLLHGLIQHHIYHIGQIAYINKFL